MRGLPTAAGATPEASHSMREGSAREQGLRQLSAPLHGAESRPRSESGLPALGAGSSGRYTEWSMSRPEIGKGSGPFARLRVNIHFTVLQQQS